MQTTGLGKLDESNSPFTIVLGVAQDAGYPQAGDRTSPAWNDPSLRRLATCLGLIDPQTNRRWLFDATPDFKEQLHRLDVIAPTAEVPGFDAIFLTHAHIGHYTGLMQLGIEGMGAHLVPVYAMPRMERFIRTNGPWEQLVALENIEIRPLENMIPVELAPDLRVTPLLVPHRDEYSETVGFRIEGPDRSVLFIPDITGWDAWEADGTQLEEVLPDVDVAYLDGTFFTGDELPGRDLSTIKHPMIADSIERFAALPECERRKVRFIHLNQSNPLIRDDSRALATLKASGCGLAHEGEIVRI
jgi:pyrroloquinoline quinone biosynthesis protein B